MFAESLTQPNILLVVADDHGPWSIGAYGNRECRTTTLDRLARDGVCFTQALTPSPVCSPARACLLTGQTPSRVGIHDWLDESQSEIRERDWLAGVPTLHRLLTDAGYHTGLSGKWHLGQSQRVPDGIAFCFTMPHGQGVQDGRHTFQFNGDMLELYGRKSDFVTQYAEQFIDEAPRDRPFFLNVGYTATHSDYHVRAQRSDLVQHYAKATFHDIPSAPPHPWRKNEGFPEHDLRDPREHRARKQGYYAAVTETDEHIGRLLDHLERSGRSNNTLVIYTSDHGCALGHQGFWGKGNSTRPLNMYEVSLLVPLLVRIPSRASVGRVVRQPVDHYDTFATICDFAGVTSSDTEYSGRSFAALLNETQASRGNDELPSRVKYGEYGDLRMVRTPEWKLIRRYGHGPDELYDLEADPEERHNLARHPKHAEQKRILMADLERWYAEHDDPARSGMAVASLPRHNFGAEAWRDGKR